MSNTPLDRLLDEARHLVIRKGSTLDRLVRIVEQLHAGIGEHLKAIESKEIEVTDYAEDVDGNEMRTTRKTKVRTISTGEKRFKDLLVICNRIAEGKEDDNG